jgi:RNA polymerase sigma-70 factor (ECF subfamily)
MTEKARPGHGSRMSVPGASAPSPNQPNLVLPTFEAVYAEEFAFVWRNLRRMGVRDASLRDATQDVFLVVHRRLGEFERRAPLRSWLFSIVKRVASHHRRTQQRRDVNNDEEADALPGAWTGPEQHAADSEALRFFLSLLEELDDDKRAVFVLSELEEMTANEIAAALSCNVNTVYSRLRLAREKLRAAYERRRGKKREET